MPLSVPRSLEINQFDFDVEQPDALNRQDPAIELLLGCSGSQPSLSPEMAQASVSTPALKQTPLIVPTATQTILPAKESVHGALGENPNLSIKQLKQALKKEYKGFVSCVDNKFDKSGRVRYAYRLATSDMPEGTQLTFETFETLKQFNRNLGCLCDQKNEPFVTWSDAASEYKKLTGVLPRHRNHNSDNFSSIDGRGDGALIDNEAGIDNIGIEAQAPVGVVVAVDQSAAGASALFPRPRQLSPKVVSGGSLEVNSPSGVIEVEQSGKIMECPIAQLLSKIIKKTVWKNLKVMCDDVLLDGEKLEYLSCMAEDNESAETLDGLKNRIKKAWDRMKHDENLNTQHINLEVDEKRERNYGRVVCLQIKWKARVRKNQPNGKAKATTKTCMTFKSAREEREKLMGTASVNSGHDSDGGTGQYTAGRLQQGASGALLGSGKRKRESFPNVGLGITGGRQDHVHSNKEAKLASVPPSSSPDRQGKYLSVWGDIVSSEPQNGGIKPAIDQVGVPKFGDAEPLGNPFNRQGSHAGQVGLFGVQGVDRLAKQDVDVCNRLMEAAKSCCVEGGDVREFLKKVNAVTDYLGGGALVPASGREPFGL